MQVTVNGAGEKAFSSYAAHSAMDLPPRQCQVVAWLVWRGPSIHHYS